MSRRDDNVESGIRRLQRITPPGKHRFTSTPWRGRRRQLPRDRRDARVRGAEPEDIRAPSKFEGASGSAAAIFNHSL